MRNAFRPTALFALMAMASLSACSRESEQPALVEDNMTTDLPVDENPDLNSVEALPAENVTINIVNAVEPPPEFSDLEQMRDDADATGMTARLPTEDVPGSSANEAQPAQ